MTASKSNTTQWRKRQAALGFVRVEVQVRKEDATLIREVASALGDPARHDTTRALLCEKLAPVSSKSLKALLASAPLDGIELERVQDFGREVDL